jgi:acetyl-CoA C-acetyltransferase
VIAGGTEMMSFTAAYGAELANAGIKPLGMGSGNAALDAIHPQSHQGICGDAIASMEGITREELDALALSSQEKAARAIREGRFDRSVVTVYNEDRAFPSCRQQLGRGRWCRCAPDHLKGLCRQKWPEAARPHRRLCQYR